MIDLMSLNPQQLDRFIHLQSILQRQKDEQAKIRDLRKYYAGDHPVLLTQRQQEFLGPLLTEGEFTFTHNLVRTIIDTLRERLEVQGFTVNGASADDVSEVNGASADDASEDDGDPNADVATQLWDWWTDNRMDSQQIRLYRRALRDGKSYVIVDYDPEEGRPRINLHKADDGTTGVTYHRDPSNPNIGLFASRYFYTFDTEKPNATGLERKTVYLPHEIRKYIRDSNQPYGWREYPEEGDPDWPIPWRDRRGKPLGLNTFEFQNPGGSEISQVIALQNALNKSWLDLIAAADTSGFPITSIEYADPEAGVIEDDTDIEGTDEFQIAPGRWIELFGAKLNRLPPADLKSLIETIWTIVQAISGVSRTPQYYLRPFGGSDVPSGEALKQLESGLVKRAEERQLVFGQSWEDVFALAARVAATFGSFRLPDEMRIDTQWADPNVRFELAEAQVAEAHDRLGVPRDRTWQRLGYSPSDIARMRADERAGRAAEVAQIAQAIAVQERRNQPQVNPQQPGESL